MPCQLEQEAIPSTGRQGHDLASPPRPRSISANCPAPTSHAAAAAASYWVCGGGQQGAGNGQKKIVTPASTGDVTNHSQVFARKKKGDHLPSTSFDSTCRWVLSIRAENAEMSFRHTVVVLPERLVPLGSVSLAYFYNLVRMKGFKAVESPESQAQNHRIMWSDSHPIHVAPERECVCVT